MQVHPTATQAAKGFAFEKASGISSCKRNYQDPNPKPEIAISLTEMLLMGGFLDRSKLVERFKRYDCVYQPFKSLIDALDTVVAPDEMMRLKQSLYEKVMRLPASEVKAISSQLREVLADQRFKEERLEYWVKQSQEKYPDDVGIFSFFMLNLVLLTPQGHPVSEREGGDDLRLGPGEAFFTPAGVSYFYLKGACVEHMVNSDNVLRAGFTPKQKDIDELLRVVDYRELGLNALSVQPERDDSVPGLQQSVYHKAGNKDFATEVVTHVDAGVKLSAKALDKPQIGVVLSGAVSLYWPEEGWPEEGWPDEAWSEKGRQVFKQGESFLIPGVAQDKTYALTALVPKSRYVKASTPVSD